MKTLFFAVIFVLISSLLFGCQSPDNAGEIFTDCEQCPEMIIIPGGSFQFGSPANEPYRMASEEGPQYTISIASLAVSVTEVTENSWRKCVADGMCAAGGSRAGNSETGRLPVTEVSWDDITEAGGYLDWINSKTEGSPYRLPSEAEWEYFARAGAKGAFPRGNKISSDEANYRGTEKFLGGEASEYRRRLINVRSFPANDFGLYDVQGNILEWTADCWVRTLADYKSDSNLKCDRRGLRGGSWLDEPNSLRFAFRRGYDKTMRTKNIGFRLVKDIN